jgi:hypothetical protein
MKRALSRVFVLEYRWMVLYGAGKRSREYEERSQRTHEK